ncbi:cryptochrome/photolyase family protein [Actinokineospora fastidiosa]|uniref:Deoxyribodipyrimidine photo-lyase n=1 Tax=Actinokineospora fastidiosa TaxID=1816 RepID=A0A918G3N8_9PSEU|nr:deoxyribodipyrimidine photo-lyase [Actinokineospora fastidiosa]GGS15470.1 deoxyribodipyrimidine photo-lyase [Actinokineospora fastidiosa]
MPPSIVWFRRDLRLRDHPALLAAADRGHDALALFVVDPALTAPAGAARLAFLHGCLRALDEQLGGRLMVADGDPAVVVPRVARSVGATSVHVSADAGPYGRTRDLAVEHALSDVEFVRTGSPYAVTPGRITKADGTSYRVFTPFSRAWAEHGWRTPAKTSASTLHWIEPVDGGLPDPPACSARLPEPGEHAAMAAWEAFRDERLPDYAARRDRPDLDATSRMSPYLRWGCVHPRTLLADLGRRDTAYRTELAWREFYADFLWHRPETARANVNPRFDALRHDTDPARFTAWRRGETGYPIVDAGMRQLLAEGWMHNRVRMITASFLTKDLHLPWWWGARHFMAHLVDADLASNQHGWQWTAGSGTDAAPFYRVFNPVTQGRKFDPDGAYIRRHIPELRHHDGDVHEPRNAPGYPPPIVDHAEERKVALDRYGEISG